MHAKKSCPRFCWDRTNIPAVPPGLVQMYPLTAYHHTPAFDYGAPSPSYILGTYGSFLFALRSPFGSNVPAAISPSAALSWAGDTAYSLSFNGLTQCSTEAQKVQVIFILFEDIVCFHYPKKFCGGLDKVISQVYKRSRKGKGVFENFLKGAFSFFCIIYSQTVESLSLHHQTTGEGKGVFDEKSSGRPSLYTV